MKRSRLQTTLGTLALLLVTSSAFGFSATTVVPNAGPKGGGQLVTITGTGLDGTVTGVTLDGISASSIVGFNATNTELYVITGVGHGGTGPVILNPGAIAATGTYTYLKPTQINMVQVKISVRMSPATQITWDSNTPNDDLGHAVAGNTGDFSWFVRDAQLSLARGIGNTAGYFVDANSTYTINDADNFGPPNGLLTQPNVQNVSTTGTSAQIFATARITAGTWVLDTASNATQNHFTLSAKNSGGTFVALSASATTLHAALASGSTFSIVLQLLTPKTTNDTSAQLATVQITATP